ncbi:MAG: hypothetical protein HC815_06025 [Richelia sp. RM1_1_1]|nr:hypothetical protein [Richelia sp. RM1_1_1]
MQLLQKSTYCETQNIDADPVKHLEVSTIEYIHVSFLLWEYKNSYSKREYRELLDGYGWDKGSTEERRALKLAEHFQDFAHRPHALIQIPVTTLLKLCSEKYLPIINELNQLDEDDITCDRVLDLIKQRQALLKKEKESELPEKPSIWRRNCRGERYAQFPPVYENDQQTGVLTQKLMDEYGLIPQTILREAIADLYQKITEGQQEGSAACDVDLNINNGTHDANGDDYDYNQPVLQVPTNQSQTVEDKWQELNQQLQADINNTGKIDKHTGDLIAENCIRWEAAVPQDKKWDAIAHVTNRSAISLGHLSDYAYSHNPQWRETWETTLASYYNFEQELEWVGTTIQNEALIPEIEIVPESTAFVSNEEYLEEPEESDTELESTPLDKAINALIEGEWEDIRNIFNQHPEVKVKAWKALSATQKQRVIDITPETTKVLNNAKKRV